MMAPPTFPPPVGRTFIAPPLCQKEGKSEIWINLGLSNPTSDSRIPPYTPALAQAGISEAMYDELLKYLTDYIEGRTCHPMVVGCIMIWTVAYCIGLPCCLGLMCYQKQTIEEAKAKFAAAGWGGDSELVLVQASGQSAGVGYDEKGQALMHMIGGGKGRPRYPAAMWPPLGFNIVVRIPDGGALNQVWPRDTSSAGMAGQAQQMMAGMAAMVQGVSQMQQPPAPVEAVVMAAPIEPAMMQRDGGANLADEISKLADLRAQGILNEEQFEAAKAKLLGTA